MGIKIQISHDLYVVSTYIKISPHKNIIFFIDLLPYEFQAPTLRGTSTGPILEVLIATKFYYNDGIQREGSH
jgi:hypothetical protein